MQTYPGPLRRARRAALACAAAAAVVLLAGCNGADDVGDPEVGDQAEGGAVTVDTGVQVDGAPDEKPEITIPAEDPPDQLVSVDLVDGDGDAAEPGASVTTHYVGVSWSTGEQFDASWDRGEPITFPLDGVITGWQDGIPGMRVGGRRLLVIPPELAYGDDPPAGAPIQPGETLVFVIDLVDAQ